MSLSEPGVTLSEPGVTLSEPGVSHSEPGVSLPEPAPTGSPPALIVSACLLGVACNHRGGASPSPEVAALAGQGYRLVPVCPEVAGGLPTPRPAAEIDETGTVRTAGGADVTAYYRRGAAHVVALARATSARGAVLKARSPSCGSDEIYDGRHRRVLVAGEGVTASALRAAGVPVCSEQQLSALPWDPPRPTPS